MPWSQQLEHIAAEAGGNANEKMAWAQGDRSAKYLPPNVNKNRQIEDMCVKCHDTLNDVHWIGPETFPKRWKLIEHYKPLKPVPVTKEN